MPIKGKNSRQPQKVSEEGYCRRHKKNMSLNNFYEATNPKLDANGYMSICKECCQEIYDEYFSIYNNVEKALYLTCQDLDVSFNLETLQATQSHIETLLYKGKKANAVFGFYKSKLGSTTKTNGASSFRFKDSDALVQKNTENNSEKQNINSDIKYDLDNEDIDEDLLLFWGKGFNIDDLIFLELELSNWKKTHKCDNQAEITLLKEICIKILEIRQAREEGTPVTGLLKELQELMKTASVDPAKANAASAGKLQDCYGLWIKEIEQFRPAEWYEKQEKYVDMDGFKPYLKNYIVRPIENFLTGVRNFFVDDNIDADLDSVDIGNSDGDSNE